MKRCPTCGDVGTIRYENIGNCNDKWHSMVKPALKFPKPKRLKGRNCRPADRDEAEKQRRGYTNPRSYVRLDGSEVLHGEDWRARVEELRNLANYKCQRYAKLGREHGDGCTGWGIEPHHIIRRSVRRNDQMSNLALLSHSCHLAEDPRKVKWSAMSHDEARTWKAVAYDKLRQQLEALAEKWENAAGSKSEQPYIRATADTIKECAAELRALLK